MKKPTDILPLSRTDKLCLVALALCFLAPHLMILALDAEAERTAEEDKPPVEVVAVSPMIDCTPLVEAVESARKAAQTDPYDDTIPLDRELQAALREACEVNNVSLCDALGVIEVESNFQAGVSNGLCTGLMQCNVRYASKFETATGHSIYTPEGNIRGGVWYLGTLLERYDGDIQAALTAFNAGHDTGDRRYARAVLDASEKWGCG